MRSAGEVNYIRDLRDWTVGGDVAGNGDNAEDGGAHVGEFGVVD